MGVRQGLVGLERRATGVRQRGAAATGVAGDQVIATGVPNTGTYEWLLPNLTTDRATVLVFPSEGTQRGFGFTDGEFSVLGHDGWTRAGLAPMRPWDDALRSALEARQQTSD